MDDQLSEFDKLLDLKYGKITAEAFDRITMSKEYVYAYADVHPYSSDSGVPYVYMPFGSSVRLRFDALSMSKANGLFPRTARIKRRPIATKASKARLSDGHRRPPAARRDRRDKAETMMWRRFRSGPVIIVVEVERGLGASCFVPC